MKLLSKYFFYSVVGFLFLLSFACSRNDQKPLNPGMHVNEAHNKLLDEMAATDTIVIVNGEEIKKADFDALLRFREAVFQLQSKIDIEDVDNPDVKRFSEFAKFQIVPELIHHKMFEQYAAEKGVIPSEEAVSKARDNLAVALSRRSDEFPMIAKRIGGAAGHYLLNAPYVDARDAILRQSVATNDLSNISEVDLQKWMDDIEAWNKTADKNNDLSRKRLLEASSEIAAGGDFADVTAKYAQLHPEFGREWVTIEMGELQQDEDLYKWLKSAKVGEVSPPLDLDDGMAIVKLVKIGKGEAPAGAPLPDVYTLVRCTVYAYEYIQRLERAELVSELLTMRRTAAQRKLGEMLTSRAVLEYPNGTNFFQSVVIQQDMQE